MRRLVIDCPTAEVMHVVTHMIKPSPSQPPGAAGQYISLPVTRIICLQFCTGSLAEVWTEK